MMKEKRDIDNSVRNLLLDIFFRYHLNKIDTIEFIIRFLRIDRVYKGKSEEKEKLLQLIRDFKKGKLEKTDFLVASPKQKKGFWTTHIFPKLKRSI